MRKGETQVGPQARKWHNNKNNKHWSRHLLNKGNHLSTPGGL